MVQRLRARHRRRPGDAKSHVELIAQLAKRLGIDLGRTVPKAVFAEMKTSVPEFANASFGKEAPVIQLRFAASRG